MNSEVIINELFEHLTLGRIYALTKTYKYLDQVCDINFWEWKGKLLFPNLIKNIKEYLQVSLGEFFKDLAQLCYEFEVYLHTHDFIRITWSLQRKDLPYFTEAADLLYHIGNKAKLWITISKLENEKYIIIPSSLDEMSECFFQDNPIFLSTEEFLIFYIGLIIMSYQENKIGNFQPSPIVDINKKLFTNLGIDKRGKEEFLRSCLSLPMKRRKIPEKILL